MKELTERQREVLSFIAVYVAKHAYPPTIREIAENFSISVKGAYDHLSALKKKNRLRYGDKRSRTIEIIKRDNEGDADSASVDVPILGDVAAGRPILAEENWDGTLPVPRSMLRKDGSYFALRVRGDSMEGAGILDGDVAVIEKKEHARDGEIVVAVVEEAVTLKRFFRESSRIRLQAENPAYSPIYCRDIRILGRLACILRKYA
jgi:repressor LexA